MARKEGTLHTWGCYGLAGGHCTFEYAGGISVEKSNQTGSYETPGFSLSFYCICLRSLIPLSVKWGRKTFSTIFVWKSPLRHVIHSFTFSEYQSGVLSYTLNLEISPGVYRWTSLPLKAHVKYPRVVSTACFLLTSFNPPTQGLESFICKEPDGKYFRHCVLDGHGSSSQLLNSAITVWKQSWQLLDGWEGLPAPLSPCLSVVWMCSASVFMWSSLLTTSHSQHPADDPPPLISPCSPSRWGISLFQTSPGQIACSKKLEI